MNDRKNKEKVKPADWVYFVAVGVILFSFFAPWYMGCSGHDIASAGNHEFFFVPVLPLAGAIVLLFGLRFLSLVLTILGTFSLVFVFFRFVPDDVMNLQWGFWLTAVAYVVALGTSVAGAAPYLKHRRRR
ncbi:MAG: hypothetical protein JSW52_00730 [Candidatus Coatesbacteria bacterium]|nr:MAG: hypothetical protein JSW52_00730 [Candidatus Coatesbacteria bacterium]